MCSKPCFLAQGGIPGRTGFDEPFERKFGPSFPCSAKLGARHRTLQLFCHFTPAVGPPVFQPAVRSGELERPRSGDLERPMFHGAFFAYETGTMTWWLRSHAGCRRLALCLEPHQASPHFRLSIHAARARAMISSGKSHRARFGPGGRGFPPAASAWD